MRSPGAWAHGAKWSACGENGFSRNVCGGLTTALAPVALGLLPPDLVVKIKALACELPATRRLPLSRLSVADIAPEARQGGLVATISDTIVWRWLNEDALRPWHYRRWIFPRDPQFSTDYVPEADPSPALGPGCNTSIREAILGFTPGTRPLARFRLCGGEHVTEERDTVCTQLWAFNGTIRRRQMGLRSLARGERA